MSPNKGWLDKNVEANGIKKNNKIQNDNPDNICDPVTYNDDKHDNSIIK